MPHADRACRSSHESGGSLESSVLDPAVTVLVPTCNRAPLLGAALHSILDQTFTDFEIIVVDDGSTDGTAEIVAALRDARVRYLHQPHAGIGATLNAGLRAGRGRYVARLDSDDLWSPELLSTLAPVLERRPDVGVVYGQGQAIDEHGRRLAQVQGTAGHFPGDSLRSLVWDDCTCNVALLARRACFERVGLYDEALTGNEDWDMWLRVARDYEFAFVPRVLAYVRWHEGNFTGLGSPHFAAVLNSRTEPLDKLFRAPDLPPAVRALRSAAYANVHLFRGQRWLQAHDLARARREFGRALRVSDQRTVTALRIVWLTMIVPVLRRSALGRSAVNALAHLRRRLRVERR